MGDHRQVYFPRVLRLIDDPIAILGSAYLSLLSGTLTLRDIRYHSSNQTFRIVKCQISWRWWIRHAAEEEDLVDTSSTSTESTSGIVHVFREGIWKTLIDCALDLKRKNFLRCRIHASIEGFEWYMYNRTAAFDNILSQMSASHPELISTRTKSRESNTHSSTRVVLAGSKGARGTRYS